MVSPTLQKMQLQAASLKSKVWGLVENLEVENLEVENLEVENLEVENLEVFASISFSGLYQTPCLVPF